MCVRGKGMHGEMKYTLTSESGGNSRGPEVCGWGWLLRMEHGRY